MIISSLGENHNIRKEHLTFDYTEAKHTTRNKLKGRGNWGKREQDVLQKNEFIYWKENRTYTEGHSEWSQTVKQKNQNLSCIPNKKK